MCISIQADESQHFTDVERKDLTLGLSLSARTTFNLLENLLEWSQMDRGLTDFRPQNLDITVLVTECITILAEPARRKEIGLIVNIPGDIVVFGDKNMVQTVIRNLLSNAIKFTPCEGTITISAKSAENGMTVISVKDTGIGIPDAIRNNLFRIDANTKRPGTNGEQSTGLGLLICKEFVEKNGGEIGVESSQEGGSVFNFTIPSIGQTVVSVINEKVELTLSPVIKINNLKILIAEDDEISGKLLAAMIKGFGKEIIIVKTGNAAIETIRNNPDIDLILLDISMPELDGYEATRQIRQFNTKVIIIAQTALALNSDIEKALAAGCNDHIAKPVKSSALKSLILKYLGKSE